MSAYPGGMNLLQDRRIQIAVGAGVALLLALLLAVFAFFSSAQNNPFASANDVTWNSLGTNENDSMPLGNGDIVQAFQDAAPSQPIPFTSSRWGSLASFGAHRYPGTNKYYGTNGNSFVAIVEFGPRISARAISIGGESGHPDSPHFADQVSRYTNGTLRPVYFYPEDLIGHSERDYHPE